MMVVPDPILEARRRTGRLDPPDEALSDQDVERVVYRLQRDGADFRPDNVGHAVGRDVRLRGNRAKHRESLGGDLNPALTKEVGRVVRHADSVVNKFFESIQTAFSVRCLTNQRHQA